MEQKLRSLYSALLNIETKGNSTVQMAECLRYCEQLIVEESTNKEKNLPAVEKPE